MLKERTHEEYLFHKLVYDRKRTKQDEKKKKTAETKTYQLNNQPSPSRYSE